MQYFVELHIVLMCVFYEPLACHLLGTEAAEAALDQKIRPRGRANKLNLNSDKCYQSSEYPIK